MSNQNQEFDKQTWKYCPFAEGQCMSKLCVFWNIVKQDCIMAKKYREDIDE